MTLLTGKQNFGIMSLTNKGEICFMKCKHCKKDIDTDSIYCQHCGKYTHRFPRYQNPVFLRRIIVLLIIMLTISIVFIAWWLGGAIFDRITAKPTSQPSRTENLDQSPAPTSTPTATPTPIPTRATAAKDITSDYSPSVIKRLNEYLSTIPCADISEFSTSGVDMDIDTIIKCAFIHNMMPSNGKVTKTLDMQSVSARNIAQSAKKYFGISLEHTSTDNFVYENNKYQTDISLSPQKQFVQTNSIYDNKDGTYLVEFDIYSFDNQTFSSGMYSPKETWTTQYLATKISTGAVTMRNLDDKDGSTWVITEYGVIL